MSFIGKIFKTLIILILLTIVLTVGLIFGLPHIVSQEAIKEKIQEIYAQNTGAKLEINGDASFSILPTISISVTDAKIHANGEEGKKIHDIKYLRLEVERPLSWFITQEISVAVTGEADGIPLDGSVSYVKNSGITTEDTQDAEGSSAYSDISLSFRQPVIIDASVKASITDDAVNIPEFILVIGQTKAQGSASITGDEHMQDIRGQLKTSEINIPQLQEELRPLMDIAAIAGGSDDAGEADDESPSEDDAQDPPLAILNEMKLDISVDMDGLVLDGVRFGKSVAKLRALGDGNVRFDLQKSSMLMSDKDGVQPIPLRGAVAIATDKGMVSSVWSQVIQPAELYFLGDTKMTDDKFNIYAFETKIDKTEGGGSISFTYGDEKRPIRIDSNLDFKHLDVDGLRNIAGIFSAKDAKQFRNASSPVSVQVKSRKDDEKFEWSDEKMDFSWLDSAIVKLRAKAGSVAVSGMDIGNTEVAVDMEGGALKIDVPKLQLYQGSGKGALSLTKREDGGAVMSKKYEFRNVAAGQLLRDAIEYDKLSGIGDISYDITTQGASQKDFVNSLNGNAAISLRDAKLNGIDLMSLSEITVDALDNAFSSEDKQTALDSFTASFIIKNGIVSNDDLSMKAPALHISGRGAIDLPKMELDYRVRPKIGSQTIGLAVPVIFRGDLFDPIYYPDLKGIITQDVDEVIHEEVLQPVGDKLEKGFEDLFGTD